jgi:hypothetical protein
MPGGPGHVLITSRTRGWDELAIPIDVSVFTRVESVSLLRRRVAGMDEADADRVAVAAGDLPLAVAQAAGYMADTGMHAEEYVALLDDRVSDILDEGRPSSYPRSLASVTQLALERLRSQNPAAATVAEVCAYLAPEPVSAEWFTKGARAFPAPLREVVTDPMAWRQALAQLGRSALARIDHTGLQTHRLTQAIVRSRLSDERASVIRQQAHAILAAGHPGDTDAPSTWPEWARLLPHLLTSASASSDVPELRSVTSAAARYLILRGDATTGHQLAVGLYQQWRDQLGPDDADTLRAANLVRQPHLES